MKYRHQILLVEMPMKASDLVNTVSMILMQQERKKGAGRSKKAKASYCKKSRIIYLMRKNDADAEKSSE